MKGSCAIRFKRSFYLMAILSLGAGQISDAQVKDSIRVHVDSAINILRSNSLYSNQVNWRKLTSKIYKSLDTCKTKADTFAALKTALIPWEIGMLPSIIMTTSIGLKIRN